jgi:hypothetical protein
MTFRFYPEGCMTVVVKDNSAFTLADAAASNWTNPVHIQSPFADLPANTHKQTCDLREGKKESRYWLELPYGEGWEFLNFLHDNYGGVRRGWFVIGKVRFMYNYTTNEVGEPYLHVFAKLPKHVIVGICDCIMAEYEASCKD